MSATTGAEAVALCRAQIAAIIGGQADAFGAAWDRDMTGDERAFWCRASGLGGYAWAYASRMWADIDPTNRMKIKNGVRRVAGRAALLVDEVAA